MYSLLDEIREGYIYDKGSFIQQFILRRVRAINSFNITKEDLEDMIEDAIHVFEKIDKQVNDDLEKLNKKK